MVGRRGAGAGLLRHVDLHVDLDKRDVSALREAWQHLNRRDVPAALSPDFLRRDIAYRQQVDRQGGLSARTRQRLAAIAAGESGQTLVSRTASPGIKPGSTLLREWGGRTYTVLAIDDGFEMSGKRFSSLSKVAHHITGAHWSGPRFFGLRRGKASTAARSVRAEAGDA